MKRIITLFAAAATLFSCSHDEAFTPNTPTEKATYYASFADAEGDSRTYLDEEFKLLWHNDDRISLFTTTYNEEYKFADPTGSNAGKFEAIDIDSWVTGNPVSTTYAVYPYNEHNALSNSEILTIHFPAEQAYAEKSFGRGANTMVAATQSSTSRLLPFRNAGGYLMLKLYGEGAVKSITLEGNNDEILSGAATAQAKYGYLPLITMGNEGGKTITLTCEKAVELGATEAEATIFWLVVPPITFAEGFTITVTDDNGGTYTKSTSKELVIERNEIKSMSALNATFEGQTEDPEVTENMMIRYVASAKVTPNVTSSSAFGANIISNEWDEATGKGVITFDGEVTKINASAFKQCSELTEITFPSSLESIEEGAFYGCKIQNYEGKFVTEDGFVIVDNTLIAMEYSETRTSLTIPSNVTIIGSLLCRGCSELEQLTLHDKITTINDYAFYGCSGIKRLNIPNSVTHIGKSAFTYCNGLQQTSIGSGLQTAGFKPFGACTGKVYINYNPGISADGYMGYTEFSSSHFDEIVLSENVTEIRDYAFHQMGEVTAIYCLPTTPPTLSTNSYIRNAPAIYVPASDDDSIINAYKQADEWSKVRDKIFEINNKIWYTATATVTPYATDVFGANIVSNEWNEATGEGVITFDGNITAIGDYAFMQCMKLTSATIPDSVTTIGKNAFEGCSSLTSITIPDSVTKIEYAAFAYCTGELIINSKIVETDYIGFSYEEGVGQIIHYPSYNSWLKYSRFTKLSIGDNIERVGNYVFYACNTIEEIILSNSITSIGTRAFEGCSPNQIIIPLNVKSIEERAFADSRAENITISNGVISIGNEAFTGASISNITIPGSVVKIEGNPFSSCTNLSEFNGKFASEDKLCLILDKKLHSFAIGKNVTEYTIPSLVTNVGKTAFAHGEILKCITIPDSVTSIEEYAFYGCEKLTNVFVGRNVSHIGKYAFNNIGTNTPNPTIISIYIQSIVPPMIDGKILSLYSWDETNIYVPLEVEELYKTSDWWDDYADYIIGYNFSE